MPLNLEDQFRLAMQAATTADIDLGSKVLMDPDTITLEEHRTFAQQMGLRGGFLSAAVNTFSDPVVWLSYFVSKRFPTLNWMRGTVPQRFIGTANEFTGISTVVRPVETYFRGTTVPRLTALAMRRQAEVLKIGERMFDRMNRPNWKEEMPVVSMILEGQPTSGATRELQAVARGVRGDMEEMWGFLRKTQRVRGGFMEDGSIVKASARQFTAAEAPRHLRDYLPHIPLLSDDSIVELSGRQAMRRMMRSHARETFQTIGESPENIWTADASDRLSSSFARFQGLMNSAQGRIYNPRLFKRQRFNIPLQSHQGQELFVTDLNVVLQKYVHSAARTYALNAPLQPFERALATARTAEGLVRTPTAEPIMVQILNDGLASTGARLRRRRVAGTNQFEEAVVPDGRNALSTMALRHLTRQLRGSLDEGEVLFGNLFTAMGRRFKSAAGAITGKQQAEAAGLIDTVRRNQQSRAVNNGIASYFYSTTLGLNPWSALQNLLQPILTTAPAIGIGPTLKGFQEMRRRIPQYAREIRIQQAALRSTTRRGEFNPVIEPMHRLNEAAQRSFARVFPELAQQGIKLDPRLFDIDPTTTVPFGPRATRVFRNYDAFGKFLLQPFTNAELSNQATTFFAARQAGRSMIRSGQIETPKLPNGRPLVGRQLDEWLNFEAGMATEGLQFRPGPGSRSIFQGILPAWARQFTSFPTRAFSFMAESTVRGAISQSQMEQAGMLTRLTGGRNFGTLARMLMYGRIATNGARDVLGVDLSESLGLTVPFNVAPPGQLFAPVPLPPAASVTTGLISAATNRDMKRLQPLTLPGIGDIPIPKLLFPAGIQVSRMSRAINQWRPDAGGFVDDDERLMRRGNTTDLVMSMLGIPLDKNRRVRDGIERINAVSGRVRRFRRSFAVAALNGDTSTMDSLRAEYREAFPDWPALDVAPRDLKRYEQNARLPFIQRRLQSLGSVGKYLERDIYEVDPEILAQPQGLRTAQ